MVILKCQIFGIGSEKCSFYQIFEKINLKNIEKLLINMLKVISKNA